MSDSTRPDLNFFNLPGDNYDLGAPTNPSFTNLDATAFSSAIKISHHTNVVGSNLKVAQCEENAVDIDLSHNVNLNGRFGLPDDTGKIGRADQVITIKGGSTNISIAGILCSKPTRSKASIVIGEWMDQDYSMSSDIHLNLVNLDGSPVYFATGWVKPFSVHGNGAKWLFWTSMGLKAYWILKWSVRLIMRIPKGTKGPSWL